MDARKMHVKKTIDNAQEEIVLSNEIFLKVKAIEDKIDKKYQVMDEKAIEHNEFLRDAIEELERMCADFN
jgi:hypothetical protein